MKSKKIRILLVEDEEDHIEIIRSSIESKSDQVIIDVAQTLRDAKAYLSESIPDLILVDFQLPDGKGIKLLQGDKETQSYPVIIMTSYGDEQAAVDAIKAGALDYVVKSESTLFEMFHICERAMREWGYITERKRTEKALKTHARQHEIMASLGHRALLGEDLTVLMNEVVRNVTEILDNEYCKVLELLPDGKAYYYVRVWAGRKVL